jgi:hypothetical protein
MNQSAQVESGLTGPSASFIASAFIFVITGLLTVGTWTGDHFTPSVKWTVIGTVVLNMLYFYYWIAFTELDPAARAHLRTKGYFEWILRIINQSILFSLWLTLGAGYYRTFAYSLPLIYFLYIVWDLVTGTGTGKIDKWLLILDTFGLLFSLAFLHLIQSCGAPENLNAEQVRSSTEKVFQLGLVCGAYVVMAIAGVAIGYNKYKFDPFSSKLWAATAVK